MSNLKQQSGPLEDHQVVRGSEDFEIDSRQTDLLADAYSEQVYSNVPTDEQESFRAYNRLRFSENTRDPNTIMLFDGDVLIGMVSLKLQNTTSDGTPIIEIGSASVHPEYRGQKLSSQLYKLLFADILKNHRGAIIGIASKAPSVIHSALKMGCREIPARAYFQMGTEPDPRTNDVNTPAMEGFRAFIVEVSPKSVPAVALRAVIYRTSQRVRNLFGY